jgi:hypothetical protein
MSGWRRSGEIVRQLGAQRLRVAARLFIYLRRPKMNRLVVSALFVGLFLIASISEACNRCGRSACRSSATCCSAPVCCTPAPVTQTVCRTTCKTVVSCHQETRYRKVTCRDACGCCVTKCVPYTVTVRRCHRVPVTTCCTVPTCCPPAPSCCAPACDPCARAGLFSRFGSRLCCN